MEEVRHEADYRGGEGRGGRIVTLEDLKGAPPSR